MYSGGVLGLKALTFPQKQKHVDLSRHREADRVAQLQTRQHLVLVAPPAADFTGDLTETKAFQEIQRTHRGHIEDILRTFGVRGHFRGHTDDI